MSGGYTPPEFGDWDPTKPITADRALIPLGQQYEAVRRDVTDPESPVGAAVAAAVAAGGGGMGVVDNGDGTLTLTSDSSYVDNGDGTLTIGA